MAPATDGNGVTRRGVTESKADLVSVEMSERNQASTGTENKVFCVFFKIQFQNHDTSNIECITKSFSISGAQQTKIINNEIISPLQWHSKKLDGKL